MVIPAAEAGLQRGTLIMQPADSRISEEAALEVGLQEKAKEFVKKGSEVYAKAR